MADRKDILLDDNNDVLVKDGDFVIGDSNDQNVLLLLLANPGEFKQYPLIGFGIQQMQNGKLTADVRRKINLTLTLDGYNTKSVALNDGKLTIDV